MEFIEESHMTDAVLLDEFSIMGSLLLWGMVLSLEPLEGLRRYRELFLFAAAVSLLGLFLVVSSSPKASSVLVDGLF